MNSINFIAKLCLAFFIILGLLFLWWKIGFFDIIEGVTPSPDGTYEIVSVQKLFDDISNNYIAAKDKYVGQYFSITGEIGNIGSSYIALYEIDDSMSFSRVFCNIKSDEQKNIIKTMNKGDIVTVKGKITSIGEIKGCHLNMVEIYKKY